MANLLKNDEKFILAALNLSRKNLGLQSPNPVVGCIIVKEGVIISSGITQLGGRPHAEFCAIHNIGDKNKLRGATLYTTLEPCCHKGRDISCVELIIAHQIGRVVIATQDPDERVNGNGIAKLREAKIEVVCGIKEKEAQEINKGFFKSKIYGSPYVTLKLATSLDGKIALNNLDSKWISGSKARLFAHNLRSINDAIMIGANTLRQDNPMLNCRIDGLEHYSPKRIIISSSLNFSLNCKIFQSAREIETFLVTGKINDLKRKEYQNIGVKIIECEQENQKISLKIVLEKLSNIGINSVLVEGGSKIATQLLQEDLVDELVWIQSKKIIGDDGISAISKLNLSNVKDSLLSNFTRIKLKEIDEDDFYSIYKNNRQ